MIIACFCPSLSISVFARIEIRPRPVRYASTMPARPLIIPAVGKSGPGTKFMSSSIVKSGLAINPSVASKISVKLWGGIFVAIPTAIPEEPLISKLGIRVGNTTGANSVSS